MFSLSRKTGGFLLMLLMAVFVVLPIADALACTVEPHADSAAHAVGGEGMGGDEDGDRDDGDRDATSSAACGHGHCHHSTASLPPIAVAGFATSTRHGVDGQHAARPYAVSLEGLRRPPRA